MVGKGKAEKEYMLLGFSNLRIMHFIYALSYSLRWKLKWEDPLTS